MPTLRARAAVAAVCVTALAALVTACGSDSDNADGADASDGSGSARSEEPQGSAADPSDPAEQPDRSSVPEELDFTAQTVDGSDVAGASLAGQDAVLWFWAPWCTICAGEAPTIKDAAETHGEDVTFLGVPGLGETADMQTFVADHELDGFEHAVDADGSLWARFGVTSQPAAAFIDDTGEVDVVPGSMSESELNDRIEQLLAS